jgi:hypothetical protein
VSSDDRGPGLSVSKEQVRGEKERGKKGYKVPYVRYGYIIHRLAWYPKGRIGLCVGLPSTYRTVQPDQQGATHKLEQKRNAKEKNSRGSDNR